jgi:NAD(P)-dependent dehydrogenase (short-subunit alcohol dehydrogenase family)
MRLEGRVAVVTGGGSGIGKALAARLAADGAAVVVADINEPSEAVREIRASGARVLGLQVDVTCEADVARMAAETLRELGRIDILVNNAAYFSSINMRPFETISAAEFMKAMTVNVLGTFLCCRAVVPQMRQQKRGRIINLGSGAPIKGNPFFLHYVTSKGAVITMTRALAREVGRDNITVNALAPGFTLSEGIRANPEHMKRNRDAINASRAMPRDQHPDDLVGTVSFLASDDAAFITGQTLVVDGGSAMV